MAPVKRVATLLRTERLVRRDGLPSRRSTLAGAGVTADESVQTATRRFSLFTSQFLLSIVARSLQDCRRAVPSRVGRPECLGNPTIGGDAKYFRASSARPSAIFPLKTSSYTARQAYYSTAYWEGANDEVRK